MVQLTTIAAFKDNYIWLLYRDDARIAVVVDPGDAQPVLRALQDLGLALGGILVTHHHWDHTNGIAGLLAAGSVPVYGPARESQPIAGLSHPLAEGDEISIDCLQTRFAVLEIPGHTLGHIAFVGGDNLFCGDTLFSAGCGRLFEGSAAQMHASLGKLAALPAQTRVCCGHEYTEANLAFALTVEPDNRAAREQLDAVRALRAAGRPSLPSTIARELAINPFLRCAQPGVVAAASRHAGRALNGPVEVLASLRGWKDRFIPPAMLQ